jgi:hypothetical protein
VKGDGGEPAHEADDQSQREQTLGLGRRNPELETERPLSELKKLSIQR